MDVKEKIEVLIFISESPISSNDIASFFKINEKEANSVLEILIKEIDEMGRPFLIEKVAGGFQFRTREDYRELIREYINKKPYKLSRASLEVVGIIAKKQPITKLEIDKIRGVDSTGVINVLIERDIVKISGEKNAPGKPYLYKTTEFFLEVFGLNSLDDIPNIEEFSDYDDSIA